jgi:hypothetical protein
MGQPSLETRQRLEQLMKKLEGPIRSATKLQRLRAIQVLERIGSKKAESLLKKLATGTPIARETQDAKASLERLARRF